MPFGDMFMPQIEVSEAVYRQLQALAKPFEDTPNSVIERLLAARQPGKAPAGVQAGPERRSYAASTPASVAPTPALAVAADALPDLSFTKVISAWVAGEQLAKPNWNRCVEQALRAILAAAEGAPVAPSHVNIKKGLSRQEGYKPVGETGYSFQGLSANDAARFLVEARRSYDVPTVIRFRWRLKPQAAKPGVTAELAI